MNLHTAQILVALVASAVLVLQIPAKLFPILALLASGVEALMAFGVISLAVRGINLALILAAILVVAAAIVWARNDGKLGVTAATCATLVGAMQLFAILA